MSGKPNYYQLLHLHPEAPQAMVKAAYRTVMQKLKAHPDLGGCAEQAAIINQAYEVLSNSDKRAAYDRELSGAAKKTSHSKKKSSTFSSASAESKQTPEDRQSNAQNTRKHFQFSQNGINQQSHCVFCGAAQPTDNELSSCCSICDSPLQSSVVDENHASNETARRRIIRLPQSGPVIICRKQDFQNLQSQNDFSNRHAQMGAAAKALDVSLSGMRLATGLELRMDELLRVENDALIAVAEIVNQHQLNAGGRQYGLRFMRLHLKQVQGGFVSTAV